MARRFASLVFASALFTTNGCGGGDVTDPFAMARVNGTVTNAITRAPIVLASVTGNQRDINRIAFTDSSGRYELLELNEGEVELTATAPGYETLRVTIFLNEGRNTRNIQLRALIP
jgi:carboxypeptidase family protein